MKSSLFVRVLSTEELPRAALPCASLRSSGADALILAPTDEVIHCFVHSQLSHDNHGYLRIDPRHLHHFAWLCHRHGAKIDWDHIAALRRGPALGRELGAYLLLAHRLFHVPLPPDDQPDRHAAHYVSRVMAAQDGWRRHLRQGWLIFRELGLVFGEERLREAHGNREITAGRLRWRHLKYLMGKYHRPEAWRLRLGGL